MATINRSPLSIGPVLGLTDQADIRELARTLSPTYDAKREYLLSASRMAVTTTALVVGWQPLHVVPAGRQWRILSGVSHLVYTSGAFPITQVLIADAQGQNVAVGDTNCPWVIAAAASGLPVLPNHALTAPAPDLVLREGWAIGMWTTSGLGVGAINTTAALSVLIADLPGGPGW